MNNNDRVDNNSDEQRNSEANSTESTQNGTTYRLVIRYKDERGNFLYDRCARDLEAMTTYKTLKGSKKMYRYVKELGYYKDDGEEYLEQQMRQITGADFRKNRFAEVVRMVINDTLIEPTEFVSPPYLINLRNGCYDIKRKQFFERVSDSDFDYSFFNFINAMPFEYRPKEYFGIDGPCPEIDKFFHIVLGTQQAVDRMYEWFGYHLLRSNPFKKMAMFIGEHDTGKTTTAQLLEAFLSPENVSNLSLDAIMDDKFDRIKLDGKLANISGELSPQFLKDPTMLKALTGSDRLSARIMHSQIDYTFTYTGKLTFLANRLPGTYEDDNAFFSRLVLWEFPHIFKSKQEAEEGYPYIKDKYLLAKLTTEDELSGLFIRAMEGLNRLLLNETFTGSLSDVEMKARYISQSDSVNAFFSDKSVVLYDPIFEIESSQLYEDYETYCSMKNLTKRSPQYFGRVFNHYKELYGIKFIQEKGKKSYRGITTIFDGDRVALGL